jgi:dTDP-4-amino-4,6-dideoxygalactose transaminase
MHAMRLIKPDLPSLGDISAELTEVLESGRVTNFGKYVTEFERLVASYIGDVHVASVSSGTAGLILTLQALGCRPGTKVILPSFSFAAVAQAVLYAGGVPVFADVDDSLTIAPHDVELLLDKHTDATIVLAVHTFGRPCAVWKLQSIVDAWSLRERRVSLLYDAAHAFGAATDGVRVGSFGSAEVFSFSATKAVVCGEGGVVASRNGELVEEVRHMRNYGLRAGKTVVAGLNGKMSELHAIVGLFNLRRVDELMVRRQAAAELYFEQLALRARSRPLFPAPNSVHTFKDFSILIPYELRSHKAAIVAFLADSGIETREYFAPPLHQHPFFSRHADRELPVTDDASRRVLTLPFYSTITRREVVKVVDALADAEHLVAS